MDKSAKFWDRTAKHYDQEENKDAQTYVTIIEKTKKYLKASDVVLDFGCGTGLIANQIADQVKLIHANDTSSQMIEIAQKKAAARGIKNIEYAHATLARYEPGSFDVIVAAYVLHFVEDAVMQRINDLLKPGGLFISVTPCVGEKKSLSTMLSMMGKIGLVPRMKSFKSAELEAAIAHENFEMVETDCLRGQEYFIVARKN